MGILDNVIEKLLSRNLKAER